MRWSQMPALILPLPSDKVNAMPRRIENLHYYVAFIPGFWTEVTIVRMSLSLTILPYTTRCPCPQNKIILIIAAFLQTRITPASPPLENKLSDSPRSKVKHILVRISLCHGYYSETYRANFGLIKFSQLKSPMRHPRQALHYDHGAWAALATKHWRPNRAGSQNKTLSPTVCLPDHTTESLQDQYSFMKSRQTQINKLRRPRR